MDPYVSQTSDEILAANQRLLLLREQQQPSMQTVSSAPLGDGETVVCFPEHLGWGSRPLTAVLRRQQHPEPSDKEDSSWMRSLQDEFHLSSYNKEDASTPNVKQESSPKLNHSPEGIVKLYPAIGLGMLRQEMTAPGRLWMMLRYMDQEGRGSIRIATINNLLTNKTSPLRLCGKRQLRNLLKDGEGVFWKCDQTSIWLRSAAKVAAVLSVERLTGQPVALPVRAILEGIGAFRAHLYTAFHSGRTKETAQGERVMPIARDTLVELSGVGRSSQRAYEARVGVHVQRNFAVGHLATKENKEKQAWQHGTALFELKDFRGQQGKKGKVYLAWQLPNSYVGQHQQRPKGRQKRINRELKDLVMKGMPGNVVETDAMQKPEKLYFPNGKLAAKAYGRNPAQALYWKRNGIENGRSDLWQQLGDG